MKPPRDKKGPPQPQEKDQPVPDLRQLARETTHRTTGSRAPTVPQEHTNQPRKHGQHRGPRPKA